MHAFVHENVTIHHNGDSSGDALIELRHPDGPEERLSVPCATLVAFTRRSVIDDCVEALENLA